MYEKYYPPLPSLDLHLFHEGNHQKAYELMGSKFMSHEGRYGVRFTLYAPNAKEVRLVGNFNQWNGQDYPLWKYTDSGIWSIFVSDIEEYALYKYELITKDYETIYKTDPYGYFAEYRPNTASLTYQLDGYEWHDDLWLHERKQKNHLASPMNVYEVNFASWKRNGEDYYRFHDYVRDLIPYVMDMGYTHIEIMPVTEHPFDGSWGYQQTGYYAITSRYGTPKDFMYLVDQCHQAGIGVILDWVPCHFPKDAHGLAAFDGGAVYESPDPKMAYNPQWDTMNFNYESPEVRAFLMSNADFLLRYFHLDGLRVDAVAYMLYENMSTGQGESKINEVAVGFIQRLNKTIKENHPGILMIAEESSAFPKVTGSPDEGGLGFDLKWNMGWMNDTLSYFELDPVYRKHHQDKITFGMVYAFSERFLKPLSHDEVVHGKKSLLNKMPGYYEDKFSSLKLLYLYMYTLPGKNLLFMGGEFGQYAEWNEWQALDWHLLNYESHQGIHHFVKTLNHLYKATPALYEIEDSWAGFEWIECDNPEESIVIYKRMDRNGNEVIVCLNFTPIERHGYWVKVEEESQYEVFLNSDDHGFWGGNRGSKASLSPQNGVLLVDIPPLSGLLLRKK